MSLIESYSPKIKVFKHSQYRGLDVLHNAAPNHVGSLSLSHSLSHYLSASLTHYLFLSLSISMSNVYLSKIEPSLIKVSIIIPIHQV